MAGPNVSACLLKDGKLLAFIEEERLVRVRKAPGYLPTGSIKYCLKQGGITLDEVDYFAVAWDYTKYPDYMERFHENSGLERRRLDRIFQEIEGRKFDPEYVEFALRIGLVSAGIKGNMPELRFIPHHLAHAASAYYLSGFDGATILTIDGSGEEHATVVWKGEGDSLEKVQSIDIPNSLGWFYAAMTEFVGFKAYSGEGKTMGLAPYGQENLKIREKLTRVVQLTEDGYQVDPSYIFYSQRTYSRRFTDKLVELLGEPHTPGQVHSSYHRDVAFEAQHLLEEAVTQLVRRSIQTTGQPKVCVAGGIGMNCKMNGRINQMPEVERTFVIPASSDDGTCLGAALQLHYELGGDPRKYRLEHTYYGPEFSNYQIQKALDEAKLSYSFVPDVEAHVAQKLADNHIVGWFQGRMEFGARSLGNRSILANPLNQDMKRIINKHVKHREAFRPFCPSLLEEDKNVYLKNAEEAPYMIVAYEIRDEVKDKLPSVVHVDNTVRPQTVSRKTNKRYWNLLNEFKKITGHSVLLNTSFNVMGEPIVCTPVDAIRCFYSTGIDILGMGNFVLEKADSEGQQQKEQSESVYTVASDF